MMTGRQVFLFLAIALTAGLLLIQFLPGTSNQSSAFQSGDISTAFAIPENVKHLLERSCYDCHSNRTVYPWYARVQPVRYLMDQHVAQGKEALNFNEYASYSTRKKAHKLEAIATSLKNGSMPLPSYVIMHSDARLTSGDKAALLAWINRVQASH